jgi:hypothetical protein
LQRGHDRGRHVGLHIGRGLLQPALAHQPGLVAQAVAQGGQLDARLGEVGAC